VADLTALSRFACSDWFLSLSGYGCCAFGDAWIRHSLPVGLNGGRIIPEVSTRIIGYVADLILALIVIGIFVMAAVGISSD
jgi:hypothetical protein